MGGMTPGVSEVDLWSRAIDDDAIAFGRVFEMHADRVFGHSLRLTQSAADADDVTALVFLEAWRRRKAVPVIDGSIIGWLLVTANYTARNLARSMRRHRLAMSKLPLLVDEPDPTSAVDHRIDAAATDIGVMVAFSSLSRHDQDVLALCVLEELSLAHAAHALRVPIGTVKSRLSRAKARLARAVRESSVQANAVLEGTS
jgi:RNA polymerase sigma-70 factor (ECF subfamily)